VVLRLALLEALARTAGPPLLAPPALLELWLQGLPVRAPSGEA
jgi:hypothetical protein